jgi:hypothetical protein
MSGIASLSFSYRASSIPVTISITNRYAFCFMSLFHISLLILHVSGLHRLIITGISSCCLYATIWFVQCLFIVCVRLRTGLWRWPYSTVLYSCCLYATIWFVQCLFIVCVRLQTGLWRWLYCTATSTNKFAGAHRRSTNTAQTKW